VRRAQISDRPIDDLLSLHKRELVLAVELKVGDLKDLTSGIAASVEVLADGVPQGWRNPVGDADGDTSGLEVTDVLAIRVGVLTARPIPG
jgi:hypothetical protein